MEPQFTNPLSSWSWQSIQDTYGILGKQLEEYSNVADRISIPPTMDINLDDRSNVFISRFWGEVGRIEQHIDVLDQEIARRNNLIGVI